MKNRLLDYSEDRLEVADVPPSWEEEESWLQRQYVTASRRIRQCMGKYPTATIAVGLSVGVLIGWIIKRR